MNKFWFVLAGLLVFPLFGFAQPAPLTKPVSAIRNYDCTYEWVEAENTIVGRMLYRSKYNGLDLTRGEGSGGHAAVDMSTPMNTPIRAIANGVVDTAVMGNHHGFGNTVVVRHTTADIPSIAENDTIYACYSHLATIDVAKDDVVAAGDTLGGTGNTPTPNTTIHLHFQIDRRRRLDTGALITNYSYHPYLPTPWIRDNPAYFPEKEDVDHELENITVNPMPLIQTGSIIPVGFVQKEFGSSLCSWVPGDDGEPDTGLSQEFRSKYDSFIVTKNSDPHQGAIGFPWDNGGGQYVHQVNDMWIQDLYGPDNLINERLDHPRTALIRGTAEADTVCLLKDGFWDFWMTHFGWENYGYPITDESDLPAHLQGSFPGYTVAQQFMDEDGQTSYLLYGENAVPLIKPVMESGFPISTFKYRFLFFPFGAKAAQDGVYHSGRRVAGFDEPVDVIEGKTYTGFYALVGGEQILIEDFTVAGADTITIGAARPPQSHLIELNTLPSPVTPGDYFLTNVLIQGRPDEFINDFRIAILDMSGNLVQALFGPVPVDLSTGFAGVYAGVIHTPGTYQLAVQYSLNGGNTWRLFDTDATTSNPLYLEVGTLGNCLDPGAVMKNLGTFNLPREVGRFVSRGNFLYAGGYDGFSVMDISNPSSPSLLGSIPLPAAAEDLEIQGSLVYVADVDDTGLAIVDVSNPLSPFVVGTYHTLEPWRIVVEGNFVYLTEDADGFLVIDVTNPASPFLAGSVPSLTFLEDVGVWENQAFVLDYAAHQFTTVDITDHSAPFVSDTMDFSGPPRELLVSDGLIYLLGPGLASSENFLHVLDARNSGPPVLVNSFEVPYLAYMSVVGNRLYSYGIFEAPDMYAVDSPGFFAFDLTDPLVPEMTGWVPVSETEYDVAIGNGHAYIAHDSESIELVELRGSQSLMPIGSSPIPGWNRHMVSLGGSLAVGNTVSGLNIFDLSDPVAPPLVGNWGNPSVGYTGLATDGNYVYYANQYFQVIDIDDPANPVKINTTSPQIPAREIAIRGHYAFTVWKGIGLQVVDISDPAFPEVAATLPILDDHCDYISISGDLAVVSSYWFGGGGVYLVDISNPESPIQIGSCAIGEYPTTTIVIGGVLYVMSFDFLLLFDISDPTNPDEIDRIDFSPHEHEGNFFVDHDVLYLTDSYEFLYVFDVSLPESPELIDTLRFELGIDYPKVAGNFLYATSQDSIVVLPKYCGDYVAPPGNVTVQYAPEGNTVDWDLDKSIITGFRVYRGAQAGFAISPANLVQETVAPPWLDVDGGPEDFYQVTAVDDDGNESPPTQQGIVSEVVLPGAGQQFMVAQNAPNPFNPRTTIKYFTPRRTKVDIRVYDVAGRLIEILKHGEPTEPGHHQCTWDGRDRQDRQVAAGVYFYRLEAGGFSETKKMLLVK